MGEDSANVVAPPPFIYAGPLTVGLLMGRLRPARMLPGGLARLLGGALMGLGATFIVSGFRTLRGAGEHPDPREPTRTIVTTGPYALTRNPLYLALALVYSGVTLTANTLWPALFLPAVLTVMRWGVIGREEQYLERRFGDEYREYSGRVRRWL